MERLDTTVARVLELAAVELRKVKPNCGTELTLDMLSPTGRTLGFSAEGYTFDTESGRATRRSTDISKPTVGAFRSVRRRPDAEAGDLAAGATRLASCSDDPARSRPFVRCAARVVSSTEETSRSGCSPTSTLSSSWMIGNRVRDPCRR